MKNKFYILLSVAFWSYVLCTAQEYVVPLKNNVGIKHTPAYSKKVRATLPFIDDFSYNNALPSSFYWTDNEVFINNTMAKNPITKGVATFDGLNAMGKPYRPTNPNAVGYADSLTSQPINLSIYNTNANIYLSFFYQAQGNGFAPEVGDSLMLFFKDNNDVWQKVWSIEGGIVQDFVPIIIPVNNSIYFHSSFQFRFINIASLNTNDDVWNIDYVKLAANRSTTDILMNDVAFTNSVNSFLKNYKSMPYRHFNNFQTNELQSVQNLFLKNNYAISNTIAITEKIKEGLSNTTLSTSSLVPNTIAANAVINPQAIVNAIAYTPTGYYNKVVIQHQFYYSPLNATDKTSNDSIVAETHFDNYFAYDDGSAEKAYFLLPYPNLPAKTALKFSTHIADTIRGMMIHFAPQVPSGENKLFSMVLYKNLGANGGQDTILAQQDFLKVMYIDSINGFTTYAFDNPISIPAGDYYIGITQPANLGSDSIYYGLDVNDFFNNSSLYYNVSGSWINSTVSGSVMMRPIVGLPFVPTNVTSSILKPQVEVYPNPFTDKIRINTTADIIRTEIISINGASLINQTSSTREIKCSSLLPGTYILKITLKNNQVYTQKICKQ